MNQVLEKREFKSGGETITVELTKNEEFGYVQYQVSADNLKDKEYFIPMRMVVKTYQSEKPARNYFKTLQDSDLKKV